MRIGLTRHDYWWPGLEKNGSKSPRVITSTASWPGANYCGDPAVWLLFPTSEQQKIDLQFNRYHCYHVGNLTKMDIQLKREQDSGIQSGATLFQAPVQHRHPSCTSDNCVPYDETALQDWQDFIGFMAWRYNGTRGFGKLYHFIIWNEVDEGSYFDMEGMVNPLTGAAINQSPTFTETDRRFWGKHVAEMMKRAHVAMKRHTSGVMLYLCLTGLWQPQARTGPKGHMGGMNMANEIWQASNLHIAYDWSIAHHAYLDPENDGKPENVNFAELDANVIAYQRQVLTNIGIPAANHSMYPQSRVLASEQGWPKTNVYATDGTVLLPGVGEEGKARNICLAHKYVEPNQFIIGSIHYNFQAATDRQHEHADNISAIPIETGVGLDGVHAGTFIDYAAANNGLRAYQATSPLQWGQNDLNFCCTNYSVGCKNALQPLYSVAGSGKSELPDFDGDGLADYAEQYVGGGAFNDFYVHKNLGGGAFTPLGSSWGLTGRATSDAGWEVLMADFNGDGRADFADVNKATGQVYVHRNTSASGAFDTGHFYYGQVYGGTNVEYFAGDFDGDGRADIASRNVRTGYMAIRRNVSFLPALPATYATQRVNFVDYSLNAGPSATHPNWRTIVANMDGDARADFVDQWIPTGDVWRHSNTNVLPQVFDTGGVLMTPTPLPLDTTRPNTSSGWFTLFGDFNGDNQADFADLLNTGGGIGYFWKHLNQGGTTFKLENYGPRVDTYGAPTWRILGGQP